LTALANLQSRDAVLSALDEFAAIGRTAFLGRYGFGPSRTYMVRHPTAGMLCDSKAIVGAAYGHQFPGHGPLRPEDFSGGEATVVAKLQALGFEVVRVGEDWTETEVLATVASYFEMLRHEARQEAYTKTDFNAALRASLNGRSKAAVELKYQNISAVLHGLDLPFIPGYKPRGHAQLLLRKVVQRYVSEHGASLRRIVDDLEEMRPEAQRSFRAVVVEAPTVQTVIQLDEAVARPRLTRKVDYAVRDETNRQLGRAGEQWALEFEQRRLSEAGCPELFQRVEWVSDTRGDGAGFDILSYDDGDHPRFIEVKTTNAGHESSFVITRNELDFSRETGDAFFLYRLFQFRQAPSLYMLRGDVSQLVHLEPIDYRASFRRVVQPG
jgi:hypothetical protein